MPTKCHLCGAGTTAPEIFFKDPDSAERRYCPSCWQKLTVSSYKKSLLWQILPGGLGLILLGFSDDSSAGWTFLNVFLFQIFMLCTILPHELAHITAARLMGMRVFKIIVGIGKTLFTRKIFGILAEFKAFPAGGLAIALPTSKQFFRLKQFGFVLAGPLINFLFVAMVYPFVSDDLWSVSALGDGLAPGLAFFYANLLVLIYNLWPHKVSTSHGMMSSDGKLLLQTVCIKSDEIETALAVRFAYEAAEAFERKDYKSARSAVDEGLHRHPDNFHLLSWLGVLLLRSHSFSEARDVFLKILPESEKLPANHALILNNIAYADALLDRADLLPEAESYSEKAMAVLAWHPSIKGTRGTVLVQLGRVEEGIELLNAALAGHDNVQNKAENACILAMTEAKRGNDAASRQYLEEARRWDSSCYLLERASTFLATPSN